MKIGGKRMRTDHIVCLVLLLIMKCSSRTLASNEKADSLSSLFPHSDRVVVRDEEVEEREEIDKRPDQQAPSPKIPQQPQSEKVTLEAARKHFRDGFTTYLTYRRLRVSKRWENSFHNHRSGQRPMKAH